MHIKQFHIYFLYAVIHIIEYASFPVLDLFKYTSACTKKVKNENVLEQTCVKLFQILSNKQQVTRSRNTCSGTMLVKSSSLSFYGARTRVFNNTLRIFSITQSYNSIRQFWSPGAAETYASHIPSIRATFIMGNVWLFGYVLSCVGKWLIIQV